MSSTTPSHARSKFAIDPSGLGEYVKSGACPRYAKLRHHGDEEEEARNWKEAFRPLDPLLLESGRAFEEETYESMASRAHGERIEAEWRDFENQAENDEKIAAHVRETAARDPGDDPLLLSQVPLANDIGAFWVAGDSDLMSLWPEADNHVRVRVFDMKASYEEKTYHQIQTACYTILLDRVLSNAGLDDEGITYTIEAGIIHRETDPTPVTPVALPEFEPEPREADVRRLLREDGELYRVFQQDLNDVPYQHDSNCRNCPYNESCFTRSVEAADIRLLGLTRGEQEAFRSEGIETVSDLAGLIVQPTKPRPYNYDEPAIRDEHEALARRLSEEHGIGERLPWLAQKAAAYLYYLDPDHPDAHDQKYAPYLVGAGDGSLPEDNPQYDADDLPIQQGSLIRVYLNVQWDYLRDRIPMVSVVVDCDNSQTGPLSFTKVIEDIPDDPDDEREQEADLLKAAFTDLFEAINIVSQLSDQPRRAPVHLYFYTEQERDALMDAVKRHPELSKASAVRDLLGLRAGIDQQMVSIVQDEIENRLAPLQPSTGLVPMLDNLSPYEDDEELNWDEWKYTRESDGLHVNLRKAFSTGLFDYSLPYDQDDTGISLNFEGNEGDGWYPARARFDASIPLEYIWGCEDIDELTPEMTDDGRAEARIEAFRYINQQRQSERITREDLSKLGENFAKGVRHIERAISYKNTDIEKEPLEIPDIDEFTLGDPSLADACKEYLDLEYASNRAELLSALRQPLKQRILSGDAVPIRIENVEVEDNMLTAEAEIMYDDIGFASPEAVAAASRRSGGEDGGSGDWMVATPIEEQGGSYVETADKPQYMLNSTAVTLQAFDPDDGSARITSLGFSIGGDDDSYLTWHRDWTTDPDDESSKTYIGPGAELILDEQVDDITADRAELALEHTENNALYGLMEELAAGDESNLATNLFDQDAVDEFLAWAHEDHDPSPNSEQSAFIRECDSRVSLLQGPPGTGKTSGATSLAILGRLYAAEQNGDACRTLVTGASNKSIDEVLEDVSDALETYQDTGGDALEDVRLVRVTGNPPERELDNVEYIDYNNRNDEDAIRSLFDRINAGRGGQATLTSSTGGPQPHTVVFATPTKMYGLSKNMMGIPAESVFRGKPQFWDVLAVDEASMLPLPQLLLVGHFLDEDGQALVTGDQRQMPPVHRHEWSLEDRRTIEQVAPYVSALDYFRFLRGDEVDAIPDEVESPDVDIPLGQLRETYRCHTVVTEFLREWVYSKDDIDYVSDRTATIGDPETDNPAVETVLKPDAPLTLVLHDDEVSRQSNPVEAALAGDLLDAVPPSETTGVVTPHNAQKGLLSSTVNRGLVDTVERFQGGQRSVMFVSATVSDPDFLDAESDFILSPNRLNVALSRMQRKLVVLAPRSLFRVLPSDVDEYEDSVIWKGLYHEVGADGDADWEGTLAEFLGDDTAPRADTNISVFTKQADK